MSTVHFNGKFTAQRMTGVQRYAHNLVRALDAHAPLEGQPWQLLCPPGAPAPALARIQVRHVGIAGMPLHAWEQVALPWAARSGLLLNLAGSAPLLARRQWCTFHDAAVFDHRQAYRRAFGVWYRWHFRWLARHAQRLLTVSAHSRSRLAQRLGVEPAALDIVPNGGDHFAAVPADARLLGQLGLTSRPFVLAVGSHNPVKNLARLLQAWDSLPRDDDLRLVLVGGASPAVFACGAPVGDAAGVLRTGAIDDAGLKALYSRALGLVFPSLDEGFGLPPLEAMSLGCPVAASRAGAMPEVCGDAVLYFDPHAPASIMAALQRLVTDGALRQRLTEAGLRRAAVWTWQRSAQALLSLLPQAAGGHA